MTQPRQYTLDFNPTEFTDEERARMRRIVDGWTIEEEMEDFTKLPCETVAEFLAAREAHRSQLEAFGPQFQREPKISEAWQMVNRQGHTPPPAHQLSLNFD